ncbi:hypothetical protein ISCGN_017833 [Ixodes scapularis]
MKEAAEAVRKGQLAAETSAENDLLDICITFDGTWHKRGHTSQFGVGVAIELETGFVIDFSVKSKYCHGCQLGPKEGSDGFEEWAQSHAETCQKNFEGSSNAMEVAAAATIFSRSVELHNMQYVAVLCDGDSKAFTHVASLELYDKPIQKEDCVNHVAKRMYAGLEKLKKAKKGLGGKGKLTNVVMKKLTSYYACALKDNAPDVKKMQRAVIASLLHTYSTDQEPRHLACPEGEESWCHHNRHEALKAAGKPTAAKPHRPAFSKDVAKELVPLYNRLAEQDLLTRCSRMKTQNANESFNALIWKRCPKTEFASLRTVETAVALAVLEFNLGPRGFERALLQMEISPGSHQEKHSYKATRGKIAKAKDRALHSSKLAHKRHKLEAIVREQHSLEAEGTTYAPGDFMNYGWGMPDALPWFGFVKPPKSTRTSPRRPSHAIQCELLHPAQKKLEDATTRATAARSQRHREDSEYVDDYVGNYEAEYDAYADYSHPEAGGGASPLVAAPAPLPLGYPPYRGQPYGGFPAAPLGYPLVPPPPPMGRPLAPPPPQAFYSPQAAAAAAAVATPGLRLAEGQPLPHFTFDISQPPPPPVPSMMPAGRLPAPPVPPPSAFSRLGPLPPPPAPTLTPPKPPNAPHAFQIPLPPTASAGQSPSFLGNAATAATASAPAPASTTPQLEGLLRKGPAGGPPPASLVPEKQAPTTPVGSKTGEQAATPSPGVARRGSQRLSTGSDDYLEEAEVEGNFKPLIPLPEEVSVCTGEENEKDNMLWFKLFIVNSF